MFKHNYWISVRNDDYLVNIEFDNLDTAYQEYRSLLIFNRELDLGYIIDFFDGETGEVLSSNYYDD